MISKIGIVAISALLLSFAVAFADDDGLPADKVIASIQTAVAANPGLIETAEVDREGGMVVVEVEIITSDGKRIEVKVDPEKNEVIR
ncbi:MAG TPA: PepSY domain-containing protein [Thermodesulfobacteriota bacterium]|nr:PepSY domain-containing protein [Deltaproteobacteria bacterium]HNR12956.1 PepSY domain-containing protein [Thermodesulfobacteriota bacterium]HNU71719.1 PepSY domain-containing protein [Thermodesulfobacteriota bacterium]HOC37951.1 PepSY domain-containing protein [Thermodesulfobacteriota bacterium]HQO78693.1 PepSY domain-containing protein [Thermodesulfobacteriota bacterium]